MGILRRAGKYELKMRNYTELRTLHMNELSEDWDKLGRSGEQIEWSR